MNTSTWEWKTLKEFWWRFSVPALLLLIRFNFRLKSAASLRNALNSPLSRIIIFWDLFLQIIFCIFILLSYLFAFKLFRACAAVQEILEYGSEGCYADASTDQHGHFVLVPVLVALAIWSIQVYLKKNKDYILCFISIWVFCNWLLIPFFLYLILHLCQTWCECLQKY